MKLAISCIGTPLMAEIGLIVRAGRDDRLTIPFAEHVEGGIKTVYSSTMTFKLIVAVSTLLASPVAAEPMTCRWTSKQQCDPGAACRPAINKVWAPADVTGKRYQRCDRNGCDTYDATVSNAGAYTTFDLVGRGVFMKIGPDAAATEVVSLGNSVLVSHGTCLPQAAD